LEPQFIGSKNVKSIEQVGKRESYHQICTKSMIRAGKCRINSTIQLKNIIGKFGDSTNAHRILEEVINGFVCGEVKNCVEINWLLPI